jgi:hypothetical protein
MNTLKNLPAGVFILACVASLSGEIRGRATHTLTDSMGIAIVESHSAAWGSTPPRIYSVPQLRIGSEEAGPYQFAYVEIGFRDPNGSLRRLLRRPMQPRPVEPPMIAQYVDGQVERVRRTQGDEAAAAARDRYQSDAYGEEIPLFTSAFVDRDQRLWVSESLWPSDDIATR